MRNFRFAKPVGPNLSCVRYSPYFAITMIESTGKYAIIHGNEVKAMNWNPSVHDLLYILLSYFIGSIPSGLIIGKLAKQTDIREHGSGNLGATNAIRVLGPKYGSIVLVMDVLKGGLPILLARHAFKTDIDPIIFGIFAVVGHVYPIFAGFRGGKAVATSGGVLLFYQPIIFVLGILAFLITLFISKIVSVSSTVAALTVLALTLLFNLHPQLQKLFFDGEFNVIFVICIVILCSFIFIRHIPNYRRLIQGTERKITDSKRK